jgi:protoheme IX farnesyltransferase
VSLESLTLFLIIFLWTPPHFWALSLYRARDYRRAGLPMLPVVAGVDATRKQIVLYTVLLLPVAVWPALVALAGPLYALSAVLLSLAFLLLALNVLRTPEGREGDRAARRLFAFSILYLFALFAILLLERGIALCLA